MSLGISADLPEHLLLVYTKYRSGERLGPKFRPLILLDMSAWVFITGVS